MKNKVININVVNDQNNREQFLRLVGQIAFNHQLRLKIKSQAAKAA